jgi:hypothetical protein
MPKVIKSGPRADFFAKGGSGHMFGPQKAGPQEAGVTSKSPKGDGGKWAKGGSGHMFGAQHANTIVPGKSGK